MLQISFLLSYVEKMKERIADETIWLQLLIPPVIEKYMYMIVIIGNSHKYCDIYLFI